MARPAQQVPLPTESSLQPQMCDKKQHSTTQYNMNSLDITKTLRRRPDVNSKHCQLFYWELKNKNKPTQSPTPLVSCRDWHAETAVQQQRPHSSVAECLLAHGPGFNPGRKGGVGEQDPSLEFFITDIQSRSPLAQAGCRTTLLLQDS